MPSEFFRAAHPQVFVGIPTDALIALLNKSSGSISQTSYNIYKTLIENNSQEEPAVIRSIAGDTDNNGSGIITVLEVVQVQIDAGLNEVPHATIRLPVGRDGTALADGEASIDTVALGHIIEKFLNTNRVIARIYCKMATTSASGLGDQFDNFPWADEWVVLFDGFITHTSRRGSSDNAALILHAAHFTDVLGFSSALSAQVASGPMTPAAASSFRFVASNALASVTVPSLTPYGSGAIAIAGSGNGLFTDFWGYNVPASGQKPAGLGLKGWLVGLTQQDVFAWEQFILADGSTSACKVNPGGGVPARILNDQALSALSRIEPMWPDWTAGEALATWKTIRETIQAGVVANSFVAGAGIDRQGLLSDDAAKTAYAKVGYTYGMPIAFNLGVPVIATAQHHGAGRAFADDVVSATFNDLFASNYWQLIVGKYAANYQFALAPMADRAVVMPFQPLTDRYWQWIGSSEIVSWEDTMGNPTPIRGVILVGDQLSNQGAHMDGNLATSAQARLQYLTAAYDSCDPGVFEFRGMPPWLQNFGPGAGMFGAFTLETAGRALAAAPKLGLNPVDDKTDAERVPDAALGAPSDPLLNIAFYAAAGILQQATKAPPAWRLTTSSKVAKALWQQAKTRFNTFNVTTRFRYDIGPGSIIKMDLPLDKYVGEAISDLRETFAIGQVTRMTISIGREPEEASTHFQVGFVRTESQAAIESKLYSNAHPYWSTLCLGVPWADARWLRDTLADGASIAPNIFGL